MDDAGLHDRRELSHEVARRRAELLARTASRLLSADEPQRVVDDLCRDVMAHLGCHVFFNYLVDTHAGSLVLNACAGISPEQARCIELLEFGVAVCGCAALRAERIVVEDIQHSDDPMADLVRSCGVQTYAAHPLMARGEVIGTLSFGARDRLRFTGEELAVMKTVADHVAIALERDRTERELRRRAAEAAAKDERSRLARDLHDSVTQALFASSLQAEALSMGAGDFSAEAGEAIDQLLRLNRGALAQMRTMLLELRDEPLEAVPVQQLLRDLVEATESRSSIDVSLTVGGDVPLARPLHVAVYRVAQEALDNVVRHAVAPHAWVDLELEPGAGSLIVRDDGRGCDLYAAGPARLGIQSMSERAAEAGAGLRVESGPGVGTTVTLWWPQGREDELS
jgi:signal transduction histidine kinase